MASKVAVNEAKTPKKRTGKSLADFRAEHDKNFIVPNKIRQALKTLGDGWEYEAQFARLAGISLADMSTFRPMFEEHIVNIKRDGKRAWAGTPATANAMREMV